jgi:CheY-like chemotaxis protein
MKTLNILLVDDNEGDIMLFLEACEEGKIPKKIFVIKDGKEACDFFDHLKFKSELPDLVMLDINLPRKNGHQILKHLKGIETTKNLPVFMFTTSSSQTDKDECYKNGVEYFISKPDDANEYMKTIELIESFWISRNDKQRA